MHCVYFFVLGPNVKDAARLERTLTAFYFHDKPDFATVLMSDLYFILSRPTNEPKAINQGNMVRRVSLMLKELSTLRRLY